MIVKMMTTMKKHIYITLWLVSFLFLSACHSKDASSNASSDTLAMDSGAEVETDIDTNSIKLSGDFAAVYKQLSTHRFVSFNRFRHSSPKEWSVSNELYGAKLLTEAYDKDEILDTLIDWRFTQYLKDNGLSARLKHDMEYSQLEKLIGRFRPTNAQDVENDEEMALPGLNSEFELYISYYYQKVLRDMPEIRRAEDAAKVEHAAWKYFQRSQRNLMNAMNDGNAPSNELSNLAKDQNISKIKADADLYFSIRRRTYQPSQQYEHIKDQFIYDVYNGYIKDIKATKKIGIGPKIEALMKEQKAWFSYIFARRVFSGRLPDAEEAIYDNNTNQLQKWHLIQLKNRFEGYGYCSDAFRSSLLSDSCSYPELYKYVPMQIGTNF